MSAANEAAVDLFLRGLLRFHDIVPAVAEAMDNSGADGNSRSRISFKQIGGPGSL